MNLKDFWGTFGKCNGQTHLLVTVSGFAYLGVTRSNSGGVAELNCCAASGWCDACECICVVMKKKTPKIPSRLPACNIAVVMMLLTGR